MATPHTDQPTKGRPTPDPVVPIALDYLQFQPLLEALRQLHVAITVLASLLAVLVVAVLLAIIVAIVLWLLS